MTTKRSVIAVVDDDLGMCDALENLLSASGYRTEIYTSAEDFIRAATTTEASCLVVDIQLRDISGIELGRQLSASGLAFPIIFITGSQEELFRRQAMELGCVAYLHKPFAVDRLMEAIAQAIGAAPDSTDRR